MATIGEYVKTKEAQAEADHHFRRMLNFWLRDGHYKLIKLAKGKRGTLNYGRYVVMLSSEPDPRFKAVFPKKAKVTYLVLWGDFGIHARAASWGGKYKNQEFKSYRQLAAAENLYKSRVTMDNR